MLKRSYFGHITRFQYYGIIHTTPFCIEFNCIRLCYQLTQGATMALEGSRIFALEQKWKSMNHENLKAFKNS